MNNILKQKIQLFKNKNNNTDKIIKPKIKNLKYKNVPMYIAAFVLPAMLMWLIYIAMQVWPFGEESVLVLDLNGQYVYFFEELRNKILNGGSMLYSWSRALGGEFMGIFAYYIASPFSMLVALFPKNHMTEALLTIILLKVGSCGFTLALYLNIAKKTQRINCVIFSTMYALCSYAVVQAHNTMWIDEMIFLPLVVLGIEQMINKRRFILFTVSIAFCAMTNFYIGYMMCIFTFLYFFYYYFAHNEKGENNFYEEKYHLIKSLVRIAVFSVIALAIAMVVLYPAYVSLTFGKTEFTDPKYNFFQKFDLLDMLAKLLPGSYDTVRPEGLPFLYCGVLTIILVPIYFMSGKIKIREKIFSALLVLALVLSFNGSTIDIIWHGFQKPNWLNYRYSFMLCFFLVVLAYKAFEHLEKIQYNYILISCVIIGILVLVIQKQDYTWIRDISCIWFSIACIFVHAVILYPIAHGQMKANAKLILLIAVSLELFISGLLDEVALDADVVYSSRTGYVSYMNKVQPAVDFMKKYDLDNYNSKFYRMEKNSHKKTNDSMALGYYGISNSTSTLNTSVIDLLNKFGYSSKSHWSKYLGGTPVSDALLGIKYIIFSDEQTGWMYDKVYENASDQLYGFYNPYSLSLAYGVKQNVYNIDPDEHATPFLFLNELVTQMLGSEETIELFKKLKSKDIDYENMEITFTTTHKKYTPTNSEITSKLVFNLTAVGDNEIFCYFPSDYKREVDMKVNGTDIGTFFGNETYRVVTLGKYNDGEEVILSMTPKEDEIYLKSSVDYFYYLDTELFSEIMKQLAENNMDITYFYDTEIKGNINVSSGMTLFTTIPYDEGWKVYVDGEKTEIKKCLNSLLSFEVGSGYHDIRMVYLPECFTVGLTVSISGLVVFGSIVLIDSLYLKKRRKNKFINSVVI